MKYNTVLYILRNSKNVFYILKTKQLVLIVREKFL